MFDQVYISVVQNTREKPTVQGLRSGQGIYYVYKCTCHLEELMMGLQVGVWVLVDEGFEGFYMASLILENNNDFPVYIKSILGVLKMNAHCNFSTDFFRAMAVYCIHGI